MSRRSLFYLLLAISLLLTACGTERNIVVPGRCLPPQAGEVIAAAIQDGVLARILPAGWRVESADIRDGQFQMVIRSDQRRLVVSLGAPGPVRPGFQARFFTYVIEGGSALGVSDFTYLVRAALAIDGAFPASPWIPCAQAGMHSPMATGRTVPAWFFLVLGAGFLLTLMAGTVLVLAARLE